MLDDRTLQIKSDLLSGRAYYSARIGDFLESTESEILSSLVRSSSFAVEQTQRDAWLMQIEVMRSSLRDADKQGLVAFEFYVPRMGKRIDVLVVAGSVVHVIEFKVGDATYSSDALTQVFDYALDMKNFHSTSHAVTVAPILVATLAPAAEIVPTITRDYDGVVRPLKANGTSLAEVMQFVERCSDGPTIDAEVWAAGSYKPTPTIIEAAKALYNGHGVEDITRREAAAINLSQTSRKVEEIIQGARKNKHKAICFVTGVPGAGKTLVGLDIANKHFDPTSDLYSVFLSGNGPLVAILCEALARDKVDRSKEMGTELKVGQARSEVKSFVQNVHHFRDECIRDSDKPPVEHVALFDEAQRAWNQEQTSSFMRRKKGNPNFTMSEPAFLISCMDRHDDWAVIVCLVGGGQEINTGEAGIGEWLRAIRSDFPDWHVHLSPNLHDSEYEAGSTLDLLSSHAHVHTHESLHLSVSMRSFRAEHVSSWVKAMLDADVDVARTAWSRIHVKYPIYLTRDLNAAKSWVRACARGSERYGIVVSSQAQRLKPEGIDVRYDIDPVHWFLHPREDVRSSYYLEDAATEFDVQGLELDWTCVVWDGDLRFGSDGWEHWNFKGPRWQRVKTESRQAFLKNAYRVLLTRARQGMVIVVPRGNPDDPTRDPSIYDGTYQYLKGLGLRELA